MQLWPESFRHWIYFSPSAPTNQCCNKWTIGASITNGVGHSWSRQSRYVGSSKHWEIKFPTARDHYFLSFESYPDGPFSKTIWRSYSPQKCKFFLWLLHKQRLSTNSRLHHCHMHPTGQCPFCNAQHAPNRALPNRSIRFLCPRSDSFWSFTDLQPGSLKQPMVADQIWTENPIEEPCPRIRSTVITCILWSIWKCRNAKIFRHEDETNLTISRRCRDDLTLWSNRCSSPSAKAKLLALGVIFPHVIRSSSFYLLLSPPFPTFLNLL